MAIIRRGGDSPNDSVECTGLCKNCDFRTISRFVSEMIQDTTVVTMECEEQTVPKLSNGTVFNDVE